MALGSDSGSGLVIRFLATSLSVEAGPITLSLSLEEPKFCEKGANGTDVAINVLLEEALDNKLTYVSKKPRTMYLSRFWLLQLEQGIRNLKGSECQFYGSVAR